MHRVPESNKNMFNPFVWWSKKTLLRQVNRAQIRCWQIFITKVSSCSQTQNRKWNDNFKKAPNGLQHEWTKIFRMADKKGHVCRGKCDSSSKLGYQLTTTDLGQCWVMSMSIFNHHFWVQKIWAIYSTSEWTVHYCWRGWNSPPLGMGWDGSSMLKHRSII